MYYLKMKSEYGNLQEMRLAWFSRLWAIATLFHLAAEPRSAWNSDIGLALCSLTLAFAAVVVLLRPLQRYAMLVLCALVPVHVWFEAPVVGNHWVLAGLVSLVFVLASLRSLPLFAPKQGAELGAEHKQAQILFAVRATVLTAYAFAAFAKLNYDFVNPAVSCVVHFQNQLVQSLGLGALSLQHSPQLAQLTAIATIAIELSVPLLLLLRPTRRLGLLVAFGFHWLLALDLDQHFWDFSSVLFAGFFLFLDDAQLLWIRQQTQAVIKSIQWRPQPLLVMVGVAALGLLVGVFNVAPAHLGYGLWLQQFGHQAWWLYGTALLGLVAAAFFAPRLQITQPARRIHVPALLLVPAFLAALNGLTPYLEIKTGFGWNMYSNLKTVAGQTNHMLLPSTLDLTGAQRDLVTILDSSDPALRRLRDEDYALVYGEFRKYAQRFPQSSVTYQWRGEVKAAKRIGDEFAGQPAVGLLAIKLLPFRTVDLQSAQRCQPVFSPAR